nr:FAD-dependent monooxygenase [Nonomuraea typhae]
MELFDAVGLGARIRTAGRVGDQLGKFYAAESLAADDYQPFGGPEDPIPDHLSPTGMCACDQDVLEPILRDHLERRGADLRFGTELVEFEQSADEVVATLRERRRDRARDQHRVPRRPRTRLTRSPGVCRVR